MVLTFPSKKRGQWHVAVIPAHITCGGLYSTSIILSPNHNISVMGTAINCALIGEVKLQVGCGIRKSAKQCTTCLMVSTHINIWQFICECQAIRLQIRSFFVWYCLVGYGTPSSDDRFHIAFLVECLMEVATIEHMVRHVFFHPLCWRSLTLPRTNTSVSQFIVILRGSALGNHSWNAVLIWATVWPACGLLWGMCVCVCACVHVWACTRVQCPTDAWHNLCTNNY